MKEKINRLSKGIFDYDSSKLLTLEESINFTVETGKIFHGSFRVYNSEEKIIKALLYSSSNLLHIKEDRFMSASYDIEYEFNAEYIEPGTKLFGYISIISDCGERKIDYTAEVTPPICRTSIGEIQDINIFKELVIQKPEEAKNVFLSIDFKRILSYYNKDMLSIYDALVKSSNINLAIEEFLIEAGLKENVNISIDRNEYVYDSGLYNFVDQICINKDGWGYIEITLSTDNDFIELDKSTIISEDFINNQCRISFIVKSDKMKTGIHNGRIKIDNISQSIEILVKCRCTKQKDRKKMSESKERSLLFKLTNNYIDFRTNKLTAEEYVRAAEKLVKELNLIRNDSVLDRLYHVHLMHVGGKPSIALTMLEGLCITKEANTSIEYAAYLYLRILLHKDMDAAMKNFEELFNVNTYDNNHWLMFFITLYLNKRYRIDVEKKYEDIKAYVMKGIANTIIYYEAALLIKENPSLLKELGLFEQKVLCFMIRHDMYERDIAIILRYDMIKVKSYDLKLYYIIKKYYDKYQMKELLSVLVTMLIRGHKMGSRYFSIYQEAVNERLKIAELSEHYLASSRNADITELNHSIYMYFQKSTGLDSYKKGWLYYTLLLREDKELTSAYYEDIKLYIIEQLIKKKTDKVLGLILRKMLSDDLVLKACIEYLPDMMFMHEIVCINDKIVKVIVINNETSQEDTYSLKDGRAFINIYSSSTKLIFVDKRGYRYGKTVKYGIDSLYHPETYAGMCLLAGISSDETVIWMCSHLNKDRIMDEEKALLKSEAVRINFISEELKQLYIKDLINYYYNSYERSLMEKYLLMLDYKYLSRDEKIRFVEYLIDIKLYQYAINVLLKYGYDGINIERLQKLYEHMLLNINDYQQDIDLLIKLCWLAFKAQYADSRIITFLEEYYIGTTDELYDLWKMAVEMEINTFKLEETLLVQHLFTESILLNACDIFSSYYKHGLNKKLIRAFITYYSYQYLISGKEISSEFFEIIKKELSYEENETCLLAYLKYLSKKEALDDSEILFADYHIGRLSRREIELPFYRDFAKHMRIPYYILEKYFVEYYAKPLNDVMIYYSSSYNGDYERAEMKHVCYGIYIFNFILFYGESIYYYISDEEQGVKKTTEIKEIKIEDTPPYGEELFINKLNRILAADDDEVMPDNDLYNIASKGTTNNQAVPKDLRQLKLIEDYMKDRHITDILFKPII